MAGSTSLRSICRTHGVTLQAFQTSQRHVFYKVATTDPYLSIASQPESITTGLAAALELNAASDGQRQLREALLGRLKGHVLECCVASTQFSALSARVFPCLSHTCLSSQNSSILMPRSLSASKSNSFTLDASLSSQVGTGTGAVAREVAKMEAVQAVTGIDPSPAFLERARSLGGPKEKYVEAYSTDLSSALVDERLAAMRAVLSACHLGSVTRVVPLQETASVDHALMWTTCGSETLTAPPSVLACGVSLAERCWWRLWLQLVLHARKPICAGAYWRPERSRIRDAYVLAAAMRRLG
eukprot:6182000-Pleurochrysis_carterae.AAC.6